MKEDHYLIKEAARLVGVETHVLRYWEDELKMEIHRNDMGHRYYTQKDVDNLKRIKELKDRGLQLKAIRSYLEMRKEQILKDRNKQLKEEEKTVYHEPVEGCELEKTGLVQDKQELSLPQMENRETHKPLMTVKNNTLSNQEKMEQFQKIMSKIVADAIAQNNDLIGKSAGEHAAQAIAGQMTDLTKEQERQAEERFKNLDRTLREIQQARLEAAATNMRPVDKRKQARLKRTSCNKQKKIQQEMTGNEKKQDETA
ncbi:MAG: helix-turn-helix domain-containing protein [Lachnospiraceae bacterium]